MITVRIHHKIIEFIKGLSAEALRYIIAGILTTLVNFSAYTFFVKVMKIDVTVSNVASISLAILFAYIINKRYVFRNRCASVRGLALEFTKFVGSRLFTMALEVAVVFLFVDLLGKDELLGKLIAQFFVVIGNYVISKVLVFSRKTG